MQADASSPALTVSWLGNRSVAMMGEAEDKNNKQDLEWFQRTHLASLECRCIVIS